MRKQTVNIITWYMIVGAALNIVGIYIISQMTSCSTEEGIFTVIVLNGIYISLARDIAKAHEIACFNHHNHKHKAHHT